MGSFKKGVINRRGRGRGLPIPNRVRCWQGGGFPNCVCSSSIFILTSTILVPQPILIGTYIPAYTRVVPILQKSWFGKLFLSLRLKMILLFRVIFSVTTILWDIGNSAILNNSFNEIEGTRSILTSNTLGAVHIRRHQFFEIFYPPPPPFIIIFTK